MTSKSIGLPDDVYDYVLAHGVREPDILARLRQETASHPMAQMQIEPLQGAIFRLLVELLDARAYVEVGTFTGYSSLAVALAMPPDGRLVCCDVSEEYTNVARRYWAEAGVADRVDLRIGPGIEGLDSLLTEGRAGTFDLAFIDADKKSYPDYYERIVELLRPGGVVALDNVLWEGDVADPSIQDRDTVALRAVNERVRDDERVTPVLLPVADGMTLARKR
ncbi:MAG TPA: class I SAM-dependent methyltransferase [Candidatus Limnocylindrales bacterium]|jgi:caffeoyl-CoA O-methyltransferase|nr:class I SAM-dependent methyltransferase [Candidatus Limnocylindrales bacterium]